MKSFLFIIILILSNVSNALELKTGQYYTYHYLSANDKYAHIGDDRTTKNLMIRLVENNYSIFYFKDSIGSDAYGFSKSFLIEHEYINYGIGMGFYLIDTDAWNKISHPYWVNITPNRGIVPLLAPELEIFLYKGKELSISNHTMLNVGGFIATGLFLTIKF